jgi:peptide/nickel transport system permease protein
MGAYILKRLLWLIPTLFGITIITFFIIKLAPGDPAELKLQAASGMIKSGQVAQEVVEETRKLYGLDKPLYVQYVKWLGRIVTLNFGDSFVDHRPVLSKIGEALPITLTLNILTIILIYIISIPLGVFSAVSSKKSLDKLIMVVLFVLYSLPSFWVASILITYLGGGDYLNMFPIVGFVSAGAGSLPWYDWVANVLWHLILPVTCLTYGGFAFLSRFARGTMLEVIRQDYITTARAKGLSGTVVVWKHAFRNTLIPILTLMGTLLPALLGGSVIIEQIFSIPGMGRLGFQSILSRDYPTIMAIATIQAFLTLVSLLLADLLYVVADPRVSFKRR